MNTGMRSRLPLPTLTPTGSAAPAPALFPAALEAALANAVLRIGVPVRGMADAISTRRVTELLRLLIGDGVADEELRAVQPGAATAATFQIIGADARLAEARSASPLRGFAAYSDEADAQSDASSHGRTA